MFKFVDIWIKSLEGYPKNISFTESINIIKANLKAVVNIENALILLIGNNVSSEIEILKENLNLDKVNFVKGENLCYCSQTILKLEKCTGVILVYKKHKVKELEVQLEIEKINEFNKPILGYIMV